FSAQHTLRHYETAFYDSPTADNNSFEQWRDAGESRTEQRAAAIVAKTLAEYEPPPLDEAVDAALRDFIERAKAAMPDMWYRPARPADRSRSRSRGRRDGATWCRSTTGVASRCRSRPEPASRR